MFRLKDKVVLLVGVAEGMGRATAILFAQEGAKVVLVARRKDHLRETVEAIQGMGGEAIDMVGDASVKEDVEKIVSETINIYGRVDVLYCGVGGYFEHTRIFSDVDDTYWRDAITNTADSIFNLAHAVQPVMTDNGGGSIVCIAASFSVRQDGNAAYGAAKGAVIGMAQNLAKEFFPNNIRFNLIGAGQFGKYIDVLEVNTPSPKLSRTGCPEDIAYAALYLASDESSWVTGQILAVDGGVDVGGRAIWQFE